MPMVHPPGTLGAMLAINDPIAGRGGFEVRYGQGGTDSHFGQVYGITSHPRTICQDRFDDLLSLDGRFVITNHIRFMNRAQQQEHMKHMRRLLETGDENNEDAEDELHEAAKKVALGHEMRAFCRWSLAIHADPDPDAERPRQRYRSAMRKADTLAAEAKTIMVSAGFKIAAEGKGAKSALIAQTPGAPRPLPDQDGHAAHRLLRVDGDLRWLRHAARTASAGVRRCCATQPRAARRSTTTSSWAMAIARSGIVSLSVRTAKGKTVDLAAQITAARALLRAQRRPGTQILFDVGHSNEQTILANDGSYLTILAGEDSGVAPMRLPNTRPVRAMLRYLIAGLCKLPGEALPAADVAGIRDGVDFVMGEMAPEERHLGVVRSFMGFEPNGAGARLERWCRQFEGELAWAFDGTEHRIDFDVELAGVDLTVGQGQPRRDAADGQHAALAGRRR